MEEASDASVGEAADACSAAAADWSAAMDVNSATVSEASSSAAAADATNADAAVAAAEAANAVTTAKVAPAPAAAEATATAEAVDGVVCDICLQPVRFSANLIQHQLRYHAEHVEAHGAAPVGNGAGMLAPSSVVAPSCGTPALATCGEAGQIGQLLAGGEPRPRGGDANATRTAGVNPSCANDGSGGQPQGGGDNSMLKDEQPATGTPALVHEYYKAFGDLERTEPVVPQQRGGRPSLFVTYELRRCACLRSSQAAEACPSIRAQNTTTRRCLQSVRPSVCSALLLRWCARSLLMGRRRTSRRTPTRVLPTCRQPPSPRPWTMADQTT